MFTKDRVFNDSTKKTILVALGVCLICSVLVSTTAVVLKGIQAENQQNERLRNILEAGSLLSDDTNITEVYHEKIWSALVDLKTGNYLPESEYNEQLNIEKFDIKKIAQDLNYGLPVSREHDIAQIKRMPKYMVVYHVKEGDGFGKLILPVYGQGLWSTMYGFIALDRDLRTVTGFTFYEHGETPGLGGEVDNPRWKQSWIGKQAFDVEGNVCIQVVKGQVYSDDPFANRKIDGLSGSTLTTRGVDCLVRFWLGDQGYGPYVRRLRNED